MNISTSVTQIRIDDELKNQATAIFEDLGLDLPTAVRIFLKRTVLQNGIPFSMTLPKQEYQATRAVRAMEQISAEAEKNGTSKMTLEEINAEIDASRQSRDLQKDHTA